ncbi:MAG: phosphoribosylformylglycinamidine cyclo-ligase [Omnitrophica WOR_2 bacterium RIFCSPHIGHO2_01_FULL_52_10]|nr:MAG: phosphoribosylformylglycinamidine cyclo-ligase [Omnitrophica WOR_2 bacterium RIFCSPHIGHO2_01_FULL_52_10]
MSAITYKTSGVNINEANVFVKAIQKDIAGTLNPSVLRDRGAFGSLFALDLKKYRHPVLVSSTDGVGTKLLVAKVAGKHDTVGIDLVAMNVNDILCAGAQPLFFLDYIACGRLDTKVLKAVVQGITDGCKMAGCALVGGETAEMPGMYAADDYDLAGFSVGVVEKDKIINGSRIQTGDQVIGLPSSGVHSNGFSLARRVFSLSEQKKLAPELLKPTRIYVREVLPLIRKFSIKGIAHITGGAFYEKLTKILPAGKCFAIDRGSWPVPKIFQIIQKKGTINDHEMFRTFNMGIGLAIVVAAKDVSVVRTFLRRQKTRHYLIGEVVNDKKNKVIFN